ncbi:MAG: hypothetical protein SO013_04700 [Prevotella sp.]|nr:hypothetical protein [Prevotellaceae bacterium]MDY3365408.1 hypothetical protein [Prevotella sp.]MDY3852176.1 hypothetical protein [Prevotella sp.]
MKKILFATLLCCFTVVSASAQDVYKEILRLSKAVAKDTKKDIEARKIATFKVDELQYMAMKTIELMPDSSARVLDVQAYAMYEFVNLFVKRLSEAKKKTDKDIVKTRFMNASINHSRFNDMDKDLVWSYYSNPNYITRFSLDTDWVKALAEVRSKR